MLKSAISIPDPAFFRNQNLLPPQRGRDKKRREDEQ